MVGLIAAPGRRIDGIPTLGLNHLRVLFYAPLSLFLPLTSVSPAWLITNLDTRLSSLPPDRTSIWLRVVPDPSGAPAKGMSRHPSVEPTWAQSESVFRVGGGQGERNLEETGGGEADGAGKAGLGWLGCGRETIRLAIGVAIFGREAENKLFDLYAVSFLVRSVSIV